MAGYITRVELHHPYDSSDYTNLHNYMEQAGFHRTIKGNDGFTYHLLTAEYYIQTNLNIDQVLTLSSNAAAKTNRKYSVFVSSTEIMRWYGLAKV